MSNDSFGRLFPNKKLAGYVTAIVVSHDCDLAAHPKTEPTIEFLLCKFVERQNGTYAYGKNSRQIHLPLIQNSVEMFLEVFARDRVQIKKAVLLKISPDASVSLRQDELRVLQRWLVDRYARPSFSNSFNDALSSKIKERLPKVIEPLGQVLEAVYFDVNDEEVGGHHDGQAPFELTIYLRYSAERAEKVEKSIVELVRKIKELFRSEYFNTTDKLWKTIHLKDCFALSDETMTVAQHDRLRQWDTAYLSQRAHPKQPVVKI